MVFDLVYTRRLDPVNRETSITPVLLTELVQDLES